jgi:TonB family protein
MADHSLSPRDGYQPASASDLEPLATVNAHGGERSVAQSSGAAETVSNLEPVASPLDIALSLVLKEIAEQARLATTATGAAIGLAYGSRIVCRATTGATAPDVAACLNNGSGISEACVRTGKVQVSEDVESDSRIDAATCRRFGVRSVLMAPIQQQEDRLGVIAIFSPRVNAFCDRDVATLQALSRRVAANIELAKQNLAPPSAVITSVAGAARASSKKSPKFRVNLLPKIPATRWLRNWNSFLMVLLIGLSLTVGWMLGRSGRKPARAGSHSGADMVSSAPEPEKDTATPVLTEQPTPAAVAPPSSHSPVQVTEMPPDANPEASFAQVTIEDRRPVSRSTREKLESKTKAKTDLPVNELPASNPAKGSPTIKAKDGNRAESLVVFENRKLTSQSSGSQSTPRLAGDSGRTITISPAATKGAADLSQPVVLPEQTARQYLVRKVEPAFPDAAKQPPIQGRVVVNVMVGKDGSVEGIGQVSGDPQLMRAAADAIRQWHFKPYFQNGQPVKFQSRITLNFALP